MCPVNSNSKPKVRMFNLYPFSKQHRAVRSFTDHRAKGNLSPDGVRHAVRPQGPHHAQSLQRGFVLPFLREFLFFWTLGLHKLLPAFGRAFNVSVQVPELFHGAHGLVVGEKKWFVQKIGCIFKCAATLGSVMHIKVFDHFRNISQYTAKELTSFAKLAEIKTKKQCLSFLTPIKNIIYSNGNAE